MKETEWDKKLKSPLAFTKGYLENIENDHNGAREIDQNDIKGLGLMEFELVHMLMLMRPRKG